MSRLRIFVLILLFVAALVGIQLVPRFLIINKISCSYQDKACSPTIQDLLVGYRGKSLYTIKSGIIKQFKNNINITNFSVEYKIPDRIKVYVIERQPQYSLSLDSKEKFVLIDNEGYVLSIVDRSDLPNLKIEGNLPKIGAKIEKDTLFALTLLRDVGFIYQVKEGKLESGGLLIELPGSLRVIFPVDGDREVLVGSLILVSNEIKNGKSSEMVNSEKPINTIDLRFKNPILKNE